MKRNLLLMMMSAPIILAAQSNGVSVSNLAVSAGSPTTVTFNVSWESAGMPPPWSDSVWVFVDYNNAGKMERLPLSSGATLTATSPGGKVIEEPDNNQGVWVVGNARSTGSFSATVQLPTAMNDIGGACVYASNYPPVGVFKNGDGVFFTGTPMYDLVFRDGNRKQQNWSVSGVSCAVPDSYTLVSFSDKTGAPGKIITHAVYCFPGVIGGTGDAPPGCAAYRAGNIGGADDASPSCAAYRAGSIGGSGDAWPDCASYRAGSIGGVSFVGLM